MDGWTVRRQRIAQRQSRQWKAVGHAGLAILALGVTGILTAPAAEAQFLRSWSWHADEGPPPIPPADVGPHVRHWQASPVPMPDPAYKAVSIEELHHKTELLGLRLIGEPHRKGHVFIAFAEDSHRVLHHLVFDAEAGTLLENGIVSADAKPKPREVVSTAAKPAISASSAAPAQKAKPKIAAAKAATPAGKPVAANAKPMTAAAKPAATVAKSVKAAPAPTVADKDLSPIKPQPGWISGPTPGDPNIDKD